MDKCMSFAWECPAYNHLRVSTRISATRPWCLNLPYGSGHVDTLMLHAHALPAPAIKGGRYHRIAPLRLRGFYGCLVAELVSEIFQSDSVVLILVQVKARAQLRSLPLSLDIVMAYSGLTVQKGPSHRASF